MPFYDRLDIQVPWLFYQVPDTNPAGPVTWLTDRFWDDRERWVPPGVGVVPNSLKPYFGPIPGPEVGALIGTPDEWANGLSYAAYLAGRGAGTPCAQVLSDCRACPAGAPFTLYSLGAGWADELSEQWSGLNGPFALQYHGNCKWISAAFPILGVSGTWQWTYTASPTGATLALAQLGVIHPSSVVWTAGPWDCRSAVLLSDPQTTGPAVPAPYLQLVSPSPRGETDVAPGTIVPFAGTIVPAGYLPCDGSAYSTASPYDLLYAAVSTGWNTSRGAADPGAGNFRVPDLRGLALSGAGPAVTPPSPFPPSTAHALGVLGGEEGHTLVLVEIPAHSHDLTPLGIDESSSASDLPCSNNRKVLAGQETDDNCGVDTGAAGGGAAHNNIQPTCWINWIIKM